MRSWIQIARAVAVVLLAIAPISIAAPPTVPASLPYQGLLLDGLGQPRSGSVDLTVRVFDAVIGGALVYKQSFPAVSLADGVFSVQLGPSGDASDAPSNPLTTDLATALGGDAGATSPVRFLEVTVGGDGALSRTQILSSAYALRASSAATADTAATALTATTATNATAVGGFSSDYVTQFFTHFDADGGNPPNTDPSEGIADVDGDGRANFIDNDNDGDGVNDATELANGKPINLVDPTLIQVSPTRGFYGVSSSVGLTGTNFQPGMTVAFGAQNPVPGSITGTSALVNVGPQPLGTVNVTVTLANGRSATLANAFTFDAAIAHAVPTSANFNLDIRAGTGELLLSGNEQYGVGPALGLSLFPLASRLSDGQIATAFDASGRVAGLRCRDLGASCVAEVLADLDGDGALEDETGVAIETATGSNPGFFAASLRLDPTGGWAAAYVRTDGSLQNAVVAHDRNADGDFADVAEIAILPTALFQSGPDALAVDSTGRVAYAYPGGSGWIAAWDRNDDGDFADTVGGNPETISFSGYPFCLGATFDASDRLALTYFDGSNKRLVRDLNADGDFADAGETQIFGGPNLGCDVATRPGQPLALATSDFFTSTGVRLRVDKNGDGDFADAGENTLLPVSSTAPLALALDGVNQALIAVPGFIVSGPTN